MIEPRSTGADRHRHAANGGHDHTIAPCAEDAIIDDSIEHGTEGIGVIRSVVIDRIEES